MKHILSIVALAASGALIASASASAAQVDTPPSYLEAALVGPAPGLGSLDSQRDVIQPPSSIDPGMAIDPPQTGARMPVIHPPGTMPGGRLVLPR
jgi:hypothetical protein